MTKESTYRWIERGVFIITILVGVIFHIRDEAKDDAVIEVTLPLIVEDVNDVEKILRRHEEYWHNQNSINGRVIDYLNSDN